MALPGSCSPLIQRALPGKVDPFEAVTTFLHTSATPLALYYTPGSRGDCFPGTETEHSSIKISRAIGLLLEKMINYCYMMDDVYVAESIMGLKYPRKCIHICAL